MCSGAEGGGETVMTSAGREAASPPSLFQPPNQFALLAQLRSKLRGIEPVRQHQYTDEEQDLFEIVLE
jgi:hypothetical protein